MLNRPIKEILTSEVISVSHDTPVFKAISMMKEKAISCILVVEDKKPVGIFTERNIVCAANRSEHICGLSIKDLMSTPVLTVGSDTDIYEAHDLLVSNKIRHLVTVDFNGEIAGIITQTDMINNLGLEYFVEVKEISKIMTRELITIEKGELIRDAISKMVEKSISCVVVEKDKYPIGILTERDIARLLLEKAENDNSKIEYFMSSPVECINKDASVYEAVRIMTQKNIRRLVVLDNYGKSAGLITQSDVINSLQGRYVEALKEIIREKEKLLLRTEKSLMEKTVYLDNIMRSSTDLSIIASDIDFNIMYYNPVSEKIFGCKPEEVAGKKIMDLHERAKIDIAILNRAAEIVRKAGEHMFTIERENGRYPHIIECRISCIKDRAREVVGFVLMSQDITERRKLEEELLNARKLESIGLLAGGIAHDFNNILTGILGNISLAKMRLSSGGNVLEKLIVAEDVCQRAKNLTQQLLTFSKGGAPVKKPIATARLIKDSVNLALVGSDARCEFSIADDIWPLECDEGQIYHVINNLFTNAVHSTKKHHVIQIKAENYTIGHPSNLPLREGRYVRIIVKDNGSGIPQEYLQKIFDPYFTTKEKGYGLGLTTAYSIIKRHDGCITVDSELGIGTAFYIYLPASEKDTIESSAVKICPNSKGKILVMDDEPVVRDTASEMLRIVGYETETAGDGSEAIEIYRKAQKAGMPFDAVIIDLVVSGGMGGKEAIEKLLEIDPAVRAIVSSGYSNDLVMSDFKRYGFKGVVTKPYKLEELTDALYNVINGKTK